MSESTGGPKLTNLARGCILVVFLGGVCGVVGVAASMMGGGWLVGADKSTGPSDAEPSGTARPEPTKPGPAKDAKRKSKAEGGAAVQKVVDRKVLRVGMDTGEPPFTGTPPMYFPNAAGEPDGFDVALAHKVRESLGVPDLKVVHAKYSGLEDLVRSGDVDLVISGYSEGEGEGLAYSKPYLEYGLCLVVPTKSKIKTTQDLFGKRIGIFDDDAAAADVSRLVKGFTDLVRLEDGYWDQLAEGRFDAFLYDYPYTVAELEQWYKTNPSRRGSLRLAQYNLTDSTYVVMAPAASADLLDVVNRTIDEWRASDAYADAVRTYLKGGVAVEPPKGTKVHVVAKGETLSIIAKNELGSVDRWQDLWKLNKERFPNPHLINVGDQVILP